MKKMIFATAFAVLFAGSALAQVATGAIDQTSMNVAGADVLANGSMGTALISDGSDGVIANQASASSNSVKTDYTGVALPTWTATSTTQDATNGATSVSTGTFVTSTISSASTGNAIVNAATGASNSVAHIAD
ncbi:MAG: hypothetical protein COY40_02305 [Alphaproteobacteria bacterium CG_4_10_14_0_8_um_filter_53_9]|nr:MAG: hypothetical protein COY40_02305 [Alphaproteobacteria bacterium CG_4_10_14_0_8_um_filter_53_9]